MSEKSTVEGKPKGTWGGARANSGPKKKPKELLKVPITIYVEGPLVKKMGGPRRVKDAILKWIFLQRKNRRLLS